MITTITLNAAVDKTYEVRKLTLDHVHRAERMIAQPGGKGINVARVAAALGAEVIVSGFVGGFSGRWIEAEVERLGLAADFVHVSAESRTTVTLIDPEFGSQTEIREPGPSISTAEAESMVEKVRDLAQRSRVIVFSGSLPRGVPPDYYRVLVHTANEAGTVVVLDTSGEALVKGLNAGPYMIKPNEEELADLGVALERPREGDAEELARVAGKLVEAGIPLVVISLGANGLVAVTEEGAWVVQPPRLVTVNTVGCGDALIGGCVAVFDQALKKVTGGRTRLDSSTILEALRLGTASAASAARFPCAGQIDLAQTVQFVREVSLRPLR